MKLIDRLALANCASTGTPCAKPCSACRTESAAVALELANWLDERYGGSSETASLIRGVMPEVG